MTPEELKSLANDRILRCRDGSKAWCFWRGVILALEVTNPKNLVSPSWPDKILQLAIAGRDYP